MLGGREGGGVGEKKTQGKSCLSLLHTSNHCLLSHLFSRERDLHTGRQERGGEGGRREKERKNNKEKGKKNCVRGQSLTKRKRER